jgi:hypothetical protein
MPIRQNQDIRLPTPIKGQLTLHFTAGSPGTIHLTLGNNATTATLYNSAGVAFLTLSATCQPPSPADDLGDISVT